MIDLQREFGDIDIYLFDQLLRGRITPAMRIVDAGCGSGRNLVYLLRAGCDVWAVDSQPNAVHDVRQLAAYLAPRLPETNFRVEAVECMTVPDGFFDVVISSAVLHFAYGDTQWNAMVDSMWRVLKPGGLLFCRLASSIGMEDQVRAIGDGRFTLPDGSDRYLVNEMMLVETARRLRGILVDPLKTTVVQGLRSMTTWVLRKA